jgi:deoxyribonuclease IV
VFTKNQQQWKARPLDPAAVEEWTGRVERLGWEGRTVAHASYLINLASPDDELWEKSTDLMLVEIQRCEQLGIPFLVHHPGASTTRDADWGLGRIAKAYARLLKATAGYRTVCCLENTVGAGSVLGRTFEELARLRGMILEAGWPAGRVGFCFDTCHAHAGGYDMAARGDAQRVLDEFDRVCGLSNLRVVHINDSVAAVGSRRDRHAHIGEGTIGGSTRIDRLRRSGFAAVVNHPALRAVPKILETPKGTTEAGTPWDTLNLRRLRKLVEASTAPRPAA